MTAYKYVTLTCNTCGVTWQKHKTRFIKTARWYSYLDGWLFNAKADTDICVPCWWEKQKDI